MSGMPSNGIPSNWESGVTANVYSTGQIATICHVSARTVTKWIDRGLLLGYRLPGSHGRRVKRDALRRFLHENNFPSSMFDEVDPPILLVGVPPAIFDACQASAPDLRWLHAADSFGAGWLVSEAKPQAVVLDAGTLGCHHAAELAQSLRAVLPEAMLLAVAALDGAPSGEWAAVMPTPLSPRRLLDALEGE